jgi:hypothetical protein
VLAGAGLGDDAGLAHAPGQQGLADGVVYLVGAGVVQIFALEKYLRSAQFPAPTLGVINRGGTAHIILQVGVEFGQKLRILEVLFIGLAQFPQRLHQCLGDEQAAVGAEMPPLVRQPAEIRLSSGLHESHLA